MPKVTVFPHTADVPADRDSIKLLDHAGPYSVFEVTDLLFQSDTLDECVKSLTVLRQLQACAAAIIDTITAKRNDLIKAELTPVDPDVQHKLRGGE